MEWSVTFGKSFIVMTSVSHIYVGNEEGGIRGVGRTQSGLDNRRRGMSTAVMKPSTTMGMTFVWGHTICIVGMSRGDDTRLLMMFMWAMMLETVSWYEVVAKKTKSSSWSDIYLYFGEQVLGLSSTSRPVYDANGDLSRRFCH